ncbi:MULTISPECIES: hypothetical protein [Chryseobacterium]|uniref:DUF5640 domain-containing protein n=1 Tax=Chryseobacterium camelliae TaxID=1265445 RepID=A0ABU0TI61_9FLAO|nr:MULTISPECIES: hypothetical protein [Chryseobacterium]MDT3409389.1 hypothetical protein [Pseudacidovorax intermedius]MDQ1096746.1 hypothetical protein [Chryseobacterium camelliae]MDQ1100689.1 hypothetical protein [Chryseobacterium sp. SORGH_AS_1048]MDR6088027.1 hypothetical protein [Chryseobacterium sp. SORGH_AS_0909]MDR6132402.1 hypothetical protein [Chryseobacterium sp. SORGH_AS_1175]
MKPIKLLFLSALTVMIFNSCEQIIDNMQLKKEQEAQTSAYMGRWVGNYSGDESGSLILDIKKSGSVEVIRSSNGVEDRYYTDIFSGASLQVTSSPKSGFTLYGNMETHTGTWKMGNSNGTWSVNKQ